MRTLTVFSAQKEQLCEALHLLVEPQSTISSVVDAIDLVQHPFAPKTCLHLSPTLPVPLVLNPIPSKPVYVNYCMEQLGNTFRIMERFDKT